MKSKEWQKEYDFIARHSRLRHPVLCKYLETIFCLALFQHIVLKTPLLF